MKEYYRRTPRNFDGTKVTTHAIHQLLPQMLLAMEEKAQKNMGEIALQWKEIIGEKMAGMTEVQSFVEGILTIKVKNSTLYSLLCQHEKKRLLSALQKKCPKEKIDDLKFRIG